MEVVARMYCAFLDITWGWVRPGRGDLHDEWREAVSQELAHRDHTGQQPRRGGEPGVELPMEDCPTHPNSTNMLGP